MNKTGLKPMRGKALVQLKHYFENTTGLHLPDTVASRRKCEAKLITYAPHKGAKDRHDLFEALKAEAVIILKPYAGTQTFSRGTEENLCIVLIEDIEAWSPESLGVEHGQNADGAVPRCHYCGPADTSVSSNAMLMVDGPQGYFCPRCLRDKNGKAIDPDEVTLTEEEERMFL